MSEAPTFIPATQRPDGTWRKPRRVRPGYVPPEEREVYESTGRKIVREREAVGVVGYNPASGGKKKRKNKRKSKAKQVESGTAGSEGGSSSSGPKTSQPSAAKDSSSSKPATTAPPTSYATQLEPQKLKRKLNKKLREIERLEERKANGETLDADMQMKMNRRAEIEEQLAALSI